MLLNATWLMTCVLCSTSSEICLTNSLTTEMPLGMKKPYALQPLAKDAKFCQIHIFSPLFCTTTESTALRHHLDILFSLFSF